MYNGRLIFAQMLDFVPRREFNECVARYNGNYKVQTFSCRDQFIAMTFAQLTARERACEI